MMNKIYYWAALGLLLCRSVPATADEGYDPLLFSSEAEADQNLFSILPPTPKKMDSHKPQTLNPQPINIAPQTIAPIETKLPDTAPSQEPAPVMDTSAPEASINPLPPMSTEDLNFPNNPDEEVTPRVNEKSVSESYMPKQSALPPKVDTNVSLTENLAADKSGDDEPSLSEKAKETWLGKITETAAEKVKETAEGNKNNNDDASLEQLMDKNRNTRKRANASVFDISGVMLSMSLPQAESAMKARHFTKVSVKYEIPNFIKWRNEEKCRNQGVVGYERLASCVVELAKKANHQYPETVRFSRFDTKEELEIKLTSNFTGNKVYRILYKSMSPLITGNSNKAMYLRNVKIYDFWKKVSQKYGAPDNKDEVLWGLGGDKPYLKAASGILLLEDPMLRELDYTRMSREDQRFINTDLYNF